MGHQFCQRQSCNGCKPFRSDPHAPSAYRESTGASCERRRPHCIGRDAVQSDYRLAGEFFFQAFHLSSLSNFILSFFRQAIIQRLEGEIKSQADQIMNILLQILSSLPPKSSVPDIVFSTVGAMASALGEDFLVYMQSFSPFLYKALQNHEEPGLCAIGVGLVGDITRALNEKVQPFCDFFMNQMLSILVSLFNHKTILYLN